MTNPDHNSLDLSDRNRQLLGLTSGLLALQVLNLVVFDDLRVDPLAGVLETFAKPQHLSGIAAVLVAVILLALKRPTSRRLAVVVAWVEISAFTFFHGIPIEVGPSKPYWGGGTGDALQWVGFLSILAISAAIIVTGRRATHSDEQGAQLINTTSVTQSNRDRPMAAALTEDLRS
ncbi:MAG TPA: hypothetical protein VIH06_03490 [Ilumatobacteraceae bacterium]